MNAVMNRLHRLKSRIDATACPIDTRVLIDSIALFFDPEAIDVLIQLFEYGGHRAERAVRALAAYGEAAEQPLRDCIARSAKDSVTRVHAYQTLHIIHFRARCVQVLGHELWMLA